MKCFARRAMLLFQRRFFLRVGQQRLCSCLHEHPLSVYDSFDFVEKSILEEGLFEDNVRAPILDFGTFSKSCFLIQPRVKWGKEKVQITSPSLQLDELLSLVNTLPGWNVTDTHIQPCKSLKSRTLFGKGVMEEISTTVYRQGITLLVIGIKRLTLAQISYIENFCNVPVFDRYSLILQIFKHHAMSSEAKLQIALAEIPYVRTCLKQLVSTFQTGSLSHQNTIIDKVVNSTLGYIHHMSNDKKNLLLNKRKSIIEKRLAKVVENREAQKTTQYRLKTPTVAIVGYTNAGKTSLIKCFARNAFKLHPKDCLFATLDVSTHSVRLPCGLDALFLDTIGFISNTPLCLMASFQATFRDVLDADLIVHVRDISHPDTIAQRENVLEVLTDLNLPQSKFDSMIEVWNKCDLLDNPKEPFLFLHNESVVLNQQVLEDEGNEFMCVTSMLSDSVLGQLRSLIVHGLSAPENEDRSLYSCIKILPFTTNPVNHSNS